MPLRDHFYPQLIIHRHWDSFLAHWSNKILIQLHERLPPQYFAEPHFDGKPDISGLASSTERGRLPPTDFEVRVIDDETSPRLLAVIALITPANKARTIDRRTFA